MKARPPNKAGGKAQPLSPSWETQDLIDHSFMSTGIRKQVSYLLAIMLVMLPFASVHSGSGHPGSDMDMMMTIDMEMSDCQQTEHVQCADHEQQSSADDNCCSDHCEASFSAQPCMSSEFTYLFPSARVYISHTSTSIPDPLVSTFLRPPLTIS